MSLLLEGKRAFITGGTRGIGAAMCEIFAREGADVAFSYNSRDDLAAEMDQKIEAYGHRAFNAKVSVIDRVGMKKMTRELETFVEPNAEAGRAAQRPENHKHPQPTAAERT